MEDFLGNLAWFVGGISVNSDTHIYTATTGFEKPGSNYDYIDTSAYADMGECPWTISSRVSATGYYTISDIECNNDIGFFPTAMSYMGSSINGTFKTYPDNTLHSYTHVRSSTVSGSGVYSLIFLIVGGGHSTKYLNGILTQAFVSNNYTGYSSQLMYL